MQCPPHTHQPFASLSRHHSETLSPSRWRRCFPAQIAHNSPNFGRYDLRALQPRSTFKFQSVTARLLFPSPLIGSFRRRSSFRLSDSPPSEKKRMPSFFFGLINVVVASNFIPSHRCLLSSTNTNRLTEEENETYINFFFLSTRFISTLRMRLSIF